MSALLRRLAEHVAQPFLGAQPTAHAPGLPRTQSQVMVIAARDNCLILRDGSVVAAINVGSIDDSFLSERELQAKLDAFRDFLKRLRFEVQMLIGTRPQNLNWYLTKLDGDIQHFMRAEADLATLKEVLQGREWALLPQRIAALGPLAQMRAGEVIHKLRDDKVMAGLHSADAAQQSAVIQSLTAALEAQIAGLLHWQDVCLTRMAFLEAQLHALHAPVRTFYLVTSVNPRLLSKHMRREGLSETEFASASAALGQRCEQLQRGIEIMGLPSRRATHDELVAVLRGEYRG